MTKETHVISSEIALITLSLPYFQVEVPSFLHCSHSYTLSVIPAIVSCLFSSYLPDVDTARLQGKKNLAAKLFKCHRGITHTLVFPLAFFIAFIYVPYDFLASILYGLFFGWLAHVVEDCFNKKGCPLLYPFSRKHYHIASFVSNSFISKKRRIKKNRSDKVKSPFYKTEEIFLLVWGIMFSAITIIRLYNFI